MQEKNRDELEKQKQSILAQIESAEAESFKQEKLLTELKLSLTDINQSLEDLNRPNNSILKAFSKMGSKANNVIKNVKISLMSDEDLRKEYLIYTRIRDSLEEESVSFDEFKKSPEDFIDIKKNQESTLKKVETEFKEGVSKTTTFITESLSNGEKITKELSEKAQPELQKFQKSIKDLSEKAQPQIEELSGKLKIGFGSLLVKMKDLKDQYSEALKEVNEEEAAAKNHNSTVAKTPEGKKAMEESKNEESKVVERTPATPKKAVKRVVKKRVSPASNSEVVESKIQEKKDVTEVNEPVTPTPRKRKPKI